MASSSTTTAAASTSSHNVMMAATSVGVPPRPRHHRCLPTSRYIVFFLVCCCFSLTAGLAPPHPEWKDFEPVQVMRQRLNITFDYIPKHYPIEQCRFMTEDECRQLDASAGIANERRQRQRQLNPSTGSNIKILVLLMYFPEHASTKSKLPSKAYFDQLLNGKSSTPAVNPAGSLKDFFYYNSMKKMNVEFVIEDWAQTLKSEAHYANNNAGRGGDMLLTQSIFRSKLEAMDKAGFDFAPFDSNVDGYLDGLMVIHSGIPAELGEDTCAPSYLQRLWSLCIRGAVDGGWTTSNQFYALDAFTLSGATTRPLCSGKAREYTPTNIAIIAHELGHSWQLNDYYDQSGDQSAGLAGVGSYDVMCNAYGWNYNGAFPGYFSAYSKAKSGWITPKEITEDGFYAIQPIEISGQAYIISDPYPDGEYLLIESRFPFKWSSDWDGKGLVIYHIDENAGMQTKRGFPGKTGWPTDHYHIAVQQKDGKYDIEKGINLGDATDFWVKDDVLGPGPNKWPNTDSYYLKQTSTGLSIKVTTTPSLVTQFQVTGFKKWGGKKALFAAENFDDPAKITDVLPDSTKVGKKSLKSSSSSFFATTTAVSAMLIVTIGSLFLF